MTPTARTLAYLRAAGWPLVQVVEHWVPGARIRRDLFNIVDVLAVGPAGILGIQVTSGANVSARLRKIMSSPATPVLLAAGVQLVVHGWRKAASGRWQLRAVPITLAMIDTQEAAA